MLALIYALVIIGIALILIGVSGSGTIFAGSRAQLPGDANQIISLRRQAFLSNMIPFTQPFLERTGLYDRLKNRLEAGHVKLAPASFFNLKLLTMAALAAIAYFAIGKLEPAVIAICLVFGYILPDIILNRKIRRRREAIVRLLPETVDLLGLCVEAGLDFATAVKWVIDKTPSNPMVEELAFILEEIKWGKPRAQALRDMSKRLQIPEVSSFVQTLVLAERMGTPVAEAFVILSEDTRLQRFHRGERFAMRAPIKILIPLVFCILPVIAIVIGGPILLQFMQKRLF
ncbi:MAG: type II secretion system F family protein [Candidatus Omnitrophota bacterium]